MTQQAEAEAVGLLRPDHPLHDFQAEAAARGYIQWTESPFPALDVQYDMGLGKAPISLALACLLIEDGHVERVVIVAEKNKIKDWVEVETPKFTDLQVVAYDGLPPRRAEIRANDPQVMVMTYETGRVDLANFKPRSKRAIQSKGALTEWMEGRNVLVIFDECFVAGTLVDTPDGPRPIEDIAPGDVVLNATGSGRVLRTITKMSSSLVRVDVAGRTLYCSPRHPFFTLRGLVWAQDLTEGDMLCERDEAVRMVHEGAAEAEGNSVLLTSLLSAMAGDSVRDEEWEGLYSGSTRSASRGGREDQQGAQSHRLEAASAGREWAGSDRAPGHPAEGSWGGVDGGAPRGSGSGELASRAPQELRDRPGLPPASGSSGGGRAVTLDVAEAGVRPQEGPVPGFSRVDRVQVLEPGSSEFDRLSGGEDQVTLYDLEVENHHSFSVEGLLVHNCTKLRNRSSKLHIAWDYAINRVLRKQKDHKVMAVGLTGTKIENNPSDHYNVNRLLAPHLAPSVADFEATYVGGWDKWDNITSWRYLDPATTPLDIMPLSEVFSEITLRKSKTDPDVMDQFPAKMENPPTRVEMGKAQRDFYRELEEILHAEDDEVTGITLLRQIALDPACLIGSDSAFSRRVVEVVGEVGLRGIGSAKTEEAVEWARRAGSQQMVMFTFFGQSYLPLVHQRLEEEGFTVVVNHGQMSARDRQTAQDTFRAGDVQVFLSSDAGARGLNLGVGSALLHLELPPLHAIYEQRSDRIHRINSVHPSVTIDSLVAEGTIEEPIMEVALARNEWAERVSDGGLVEAEAGSGVMTASLRKRIWSLDRERR